MVKEIEGLKEWPKTEIHIDLLRMTLKNVELENDRPWWNTWILVQEIHHHSRQTSIQNEQISKRSSRIRMDDQRKNQTYPKRPPKGTVPKNYRTITCLLMIWKILTAQIREKNYFSQTSRGLFPEEQKESHKGYYTASKRYKISDEVKNFNKKTTKTWNVELTTGRKSLAETKIQRGILQGDTLSPLLFCNCDDVNQPHTQKMHSWIQT